MRLLIILSSTFLFLTSCDNSSHEGNQPSNDPTGSVMQSQILDSCFCLDLDVDTNGIFFMKDKLYTGICIEYYRGTKSKYIEKSIFDGKLHGNITFYDRSGNILTQEIYEKGEKKRSGNIEVLDCNCSELEKIEGHSGANGISHYLLDGIPYSGSCHGYYPESSQIYMELTYKKGVLNGRSVYYKKDGTTMFIEEYKKGKLTNTIY